MLFSKKKGLTIDTLIGREAVIDGDLSFAGGLRLDGRVRGNVVALAGQPSMLVLSESGRVEGEVRVAHLVLNGTVAGPVYASELLELQSQARVHGEVHYAALEMQQGALVEGRLVPRVQGETRALPAPAEAGASDAAAVGEDAGLANVADAEAASEGADPVPPPAVAEARAVAGASDAAQAAPREESALTAVAGLRQRSAA
ncbi:hypothetical protein BKK79_08120 [Cupriavidus sp. USMAA2-4]|uniref:bactofilin family protein n=1 Tax=Cupriavidus sp. USMAA2-4 TaxID=876364 RepID=UPI0008A68EED|nr:polymer-forming cytoskeletal protein [Cupriavidus sp. USMAA2-4]AOY91770.1 hypothetical protein BKK79_08120 [Cupriavidus sp. USMAA2-4]